MIQPGISSVILGTLSLAGYLGASVLVAGAQEGRSVGPRTRRGVGLALAITALGLHACLLLPATLSDVGVDLGVLNSASLVAWCIAVVAVALALLRPIESLLVVLLPVAGIAVLATLWFPAEQTKRLTALPLGLELHIALSLLAYCLFAIAALQSAFLAFAAYKLRQHHPILNFLPPLPVMERVMFQLTAIAFMLLSGGLVLGAFYIDDIQGQHLSHKIVFSMLAWGVFAVLVHGRWRLNWRGRHAVRWVIGGFFLLALGFFGSKIVLELILHRT